MIYSDNSLQLVKVWWSRKKWGDQYPWRQNKPEWFIHF